MKFLRRYFLTVALAFVSTSAEATQSIQLECNAFGGSHTIRMSFIFYPETCRLIWHEIERELEVSLCEHPRIIAEKPFTDGRESRVHFHLENGWFMDQYGTVEEQGSCEITDLSQESL